MLNGPLNPIFGNYTISWHFGVINLRTQCRLENGILFLKSLNMCQGCSLIPKVFRIITSRHAKCDLYVPIQVRSRWPDNTLSWCEQIDPWMNVFPGNDLSQVRGQAITWNPNDILWIGFLGKKSSKIWFVVRKFLENASELVVCSISVICETSLRTQNVINT